MRSFNVKNLNRKLLLLAAGVLLLLLSICADTFLSGNIAELALKTKSNKVQKILQLKEERANDILQKLRTNITRESKFDAVEVFSQARRYGINIYIYSDGRLVFWSNNAVFPNDFSTLRQSFIQRLGNGYYLQQNLISGPYQLISLIPVQYTYAYQNQYLNNDFALLNDESGIHLSMAPTSQSRPVENIHGQYLFSLHFPPAYAPQWPGYLFGAGILLILLSLQLFIIGFLAAGQNRSAIFSFLAAIIILVLVWKIIKLPGILQLPLFSSEYYGTSELLASLGDLLVFTLLVCYTTWLLLKIRWNAAFPVSLKTVLAAITGFVVFLFAGFTEHLIQGLVLDSQISFDVGNIFSLSGFSFIGLLCIFVWLITFFAIVKRLGKWLVTEQVSTRSIFKAALICTPVYAILLWFAGLLMPISFSLAIISLYALYRYYVTQQRGRYLRGIIYLLLSSLFTSAVLLHYNDTKLHDAQRLMATRLATERDNVAEYLFSDIYHKIRKDPYIKNYFLNPILSSNFLEKRVQQLYFSGYFSKYDVQVSSYTADGMPFKSDFEKPLSYYQKLLEKNASAVKSNVLFFVHHISGLPGYMAIIPIQKDGFVLGSIVLSYQQKAFYEESVYPELLLTGNVQHFTDLNNYSYAIYNKSKLFTQKGEYSYPGSAFFNLADADSSGFADFNYASYRHLVHFVNPGLQVVVSIPQHTAFYYLSTFSFVLLLFSVAWLLFFILSALTRRTIYKYWLRLPLLLITRQLWGKLSFRYKILITVTGGVSFALFVIGFATVSYIVLQYDKDEQGKLESKTRSIATRLEHELQSAEQTIPYSEEEFNGLIKSLSDMYRSDINIFDAQGNLVFTTQPGIYDQEIIEPKMNAMAYHKFNAEFATRVLQEESIGKLIYTSSYAPLRNAMSDIIAYINIPYFSKEKELTDRISSFLVALINLYLLLFLILLLISILMARALTGPLDIIRNQLKMTSLGGNTELLEWHTDDEIGKLVKEYNSMVKALQLSANRLAQSEREGAWREMARQVAHEIKNPLTPMKLNIQRLQMAFKEGGEDIKPLFDKVTNLLIKQIDSLSQIATAFSSFAQMPQGTPETVNINAIIREVAQLFGQNREVEIIMDLAEDEPLAYIDQNQIRRVLTNLVKNATQAIPENRHGIIYLSSKTDPHYIFITVADNGTGIEDELQEKIFMPNFSTKTSGMGLGLAISKKIIENAGGDIGFTTRSGEGTTFTIQLPKVIQH